MKITYYGHSSLGIETAGKYIIIDPFISGNPKASHINVDELKADYLMLTHAHFDHVHDVERIIDRTGAKLISNHEIVTWYGNNKKYEGTGLNHGGRFSFDFGSVKAVNAIHSSSFPDGTYGGNPMGFVIKSEGKTIYLAGDTALTWDMKLIPMFDKIDLAIMPVGDVFTMDIEQALIASDFVECNNIMGIHFDTMPILEIDHEGAIKMFKDKGKTLNLLNIGDSLNI